MAECRKDFTIFEFNYKGMDVEDVPYYLKCFMRCLVTKSGIIRDNGDIDEQAIVELISKDKQYRSKVPGIKENINNCEVLLRNQTCGAVFDFMECVIKNLEKQSASNQ